MSGTRRFELVDGSSSKFWEIALEGTGVTTRYGKIGTAGQSTTKDEGSPEKAQKLYEKLVKEKTGKGYVERGAGAAAAVPAAKKTYRDRFLAMVEQLKNDARFEVEKFEIGKPASPKLIAEATKAAGGSLPPGVAELYAEFNGLSLVWKQVDGFDDDLEGEEPAGYIDIQPLYATSVAGGVFSDWRDSLYFEDDDPLAAMKPFDNSGGELGANTHAVFFPVPGKATIHYHHDGDLHPTGYTLEGYLERLLVSRGFRYWTGSLCVDLREDSVAKEFLHDAPLLFSDFDAKLFKPNTKKGQVDFDE